MFHRCFRTGWSCEHQLVPERASLGCYKTAKRMARHAGKDNVRKRALCACPYPRISRQSNLMLGRFVFRYSGIPSYSGIFCWVYFFNIFPMHPVQHVFTPEVVERVVLKRKTLMVCTVCPKRCLVNFFLIQCLLTRKTRCSFQIFLGYSERVTSLMDNHGISCQERVQLLQVSPRGVPQFGLHQLVARWFHLLFAWHTGREKSLQRRFKILQTCHTSWRFMTWSWLVVCRREVDMTNQGEPSTFFNLEDKLTSRYFSNPQSTHRNT